MSYVAFIAPPDQIKNDRTGGTTWNGRNRTVGGADQEHDRAAAATGVGDCWNRQSDRLGSAVAARLCQWPRSARFARVCGRSSPCRGVPGRRPGSRTAWPGSSANDGRPGRSGERPDRPACAANQACGGGPGPAFCGKQSRLVIAHDNVMRTAASCCFTVGARYFPCRCFTQAATSNGRMAVSESPRRSHQPKNPAHARTSWWECGFLYEPIAPAKSAERASRSPSSACMSVRGPFFGSNALPT